MYRNIIINSVLIEQSLPSVSRRQQQPFKSKWLIMLLAFHLHQHRQVRGASARTRTTHNARRCFYTEHPVMRKAIWAPAWAGQGCRIQSARITLTTSPGQCPQLRDHCSCSQGRSGQNHADLYLIKAITASYYLLSSIKISLNRSSHTSSRSSIGLV